MPAWLAAAAAGSEAISTPKASDPWAVSRLGGSTAQLDLRQTEAGVSGVLRRPAAPTTWLNELKRLTSVRQSLARRQFWDSLPWVTKVFTVVSLLDALYIFALSIEQLVVVSPRSGSSCCAVWTNSPDPAQLDKMQHLVC